MGIISGDFHFSILIDEEKHPGRDVKQPACDCTAVQATNKRVNASHHPNKRFSHARRRTKKYITIQTKTCIHGSKRFL